MANRSDRKDRKYHKDRPYRQRSRRYGSARSYRSDGSKSGGVSDISDVSDMTDISDTSGSSDITGSYDDHDGYDTDDSDEAAAVSGRSSYPSRYSRPSRGYQHVKSPTTVEAQIEKLKSRGCIVEDYKHAVCALSNINYYRLAHYFAIFLETKTRYREGTSFEAVMHIYDFDKMMRSLLLTALEEIEITMRANISNYHALKYGALGYLNGSSFDNRHNHKNFLKKIDRMIESNTGEQLVTHHMKKYGGAFPLWVIMELFSFGNLNTFFVDMKTEDKRAVADNAFGLPYRCVENWLQCLSELRNQCAHYNRLYANPLPLTPKSIPGCERTMSNTLFDYILICKQLFPRSEIWNNTFAARLSMLIAQYDDVIDLQLIGFPDNWRELIMDAEE